MKKVLILFVIIVTISACVFFTFFVLHRYDLYLFEGLRTATQGKAEKDVAITKIFAKYVGENELQQITNDFGGYPLAQSVTRSTDIDYKAEPHKAFVYYFTDCAHDRIFVFKYIGYDEKTGHDVQLGYLCMQCHQAHLGEISVAVKKISNDAAMHEKLKKLQEERECARKHAQFWYEKAQSYENFKKSVNLYIPIFN